jgi:bacteriochlorophyllide a dehydrogenase
MKAEAVVFPEPGKIEFRTVTCPQPGADDVVVRVLHSWISIGTEGSYLRGERTGGDTPYRKGDPVPFPIVPGYQKVGVVEAVGSNVSDLGPGDKVFCTGGRVCDTFFDVGGHVSPSVSPRSQTWALPDQPEPLAYSGLVVTQVGYNCGSRAPIEKGQWSVVIGDGLVGQWAAQTLLWRGARVVVVGLSRFRMQRIEQLLGCPTVDVSGGGWVETVREITDPGIAVAVDAVGSCDATEKILEVMAHGGHIVSAGFCGTDDRISLQSLRDRELSIDSVAGTTTGRMDATRDLIASGSLQTLPLITHHFPASEAQAAWDLIRKKDEDYLGIVLDWPAR